MHTAVPAAHCAMVYYVMHNINFYNQKNRTHGFRPGTPTYHLGITWQGRRNRTTFPQRFKYFRANQKNKSMDGEQVITSYSKVNTGKDTAQNRITQEFSLLITPHLAPLTRFTGLRACTDHVITQRPGVTYVSQFRSGDGCCLY